jgi:TRAP-type C4-dicarboxylate transport system permease small subunit
VGSPLDLPSVQRRLCRKSVHGSTISPRTDNGTLEINWLALRPELVEGKAANCSTASGEREGRGEGYGRTEEMVYLEKINNFLNKILMILGSVAVLFLMALATVNVVLRFFFNAPYRGTYELVGFSGAIVIAFALGYTQKRKDHIVVDILTEKFPKRINRILDGINYFITMIFFALVSWQIFVWGVKISESGEVSETIKIIFHPFIYCVSFGFAVFSFTLIIDFLKNLRSKPG